MTYISLMISKLAKQQVREGQSVTIFTMSSRMFARTKRNMSRRWLLVRTMPSLENSLSLLMFHLRVHLPMPSKMTVFPTSCNLSLWHIQHQSTSSTGCDAKCVSIKGIGVPEALQITEGQIFIIEVPETSRTARIHIREGRWWCMFPNHLAIASYKTRQNRLFKSNLLFL